MMKRPVVLLLTLVIPMAVWTPSISAHESPLPDLQQSECEEQGGKWGATRPAPTTQCNLPTLDAGKTCDDAADCESACIAEGSMLPGIQTSGICYGWSLLEADCVNPISGGITQGSTCDD